MWRVRVHFCPDARVPACPVAVVTEARQQSRLGCGECWPLKIKKRPRWRGMWWPGRKFLLFSMISAAVRPRPQLCVSTLGALGWTTCRDSTRAEDAPCSALQGIWQEQVHWWTRAGRILRDNKPRGYVVRHQRSFDRWRFKWSKVEGALIQSITRYYNVRYHKYLKSQDYCRLYHLYELTSTTVGSYGEKNET